MSALKFARQAFAEKPHSSVSDWVDILTKSDYRGESYDGIPELVDAIDLQGTSGSAEASRALRKKLKHGSAHQQFRALVILKALVDNCGEKFRKIFQDGNLTDAFKNIAGDSEADKRVKKKLLLVLLAWDEQYKDDPNMQFVGGVLRQYGSGLARRTTSPTKPAKDDLAQMGLVEPPANGEEDKKQKKKADVLSELRKSERSKIKKGPKKKQEQQPQPSQNNRVPFNFEKDKDKVMQSIVEGSQASSNLVNAITLVNTNTDSLQQNERVKECLEQATKVKTQIVRYIRLVENEDIIGTLIETNDRLMGAIEMYERLSVSQVDADPESTKLAQVMAATHLAHSSDGDNDFVFGNGNDADNGQVKNKSTIPQIHPDLEDLTFGPGSSTTKLAAPMKPSFQVLSDDDDREDRIEQRASLSDFSDYESCDDAEFDSSSNAKHPGPSRRNYVTVSDDEEDYVRVPSAKNQNVEDDPFADPFADSERQK